MIPVRDDTKPGAYSPLFIVAAGGAVVFLVFSWFGLTAYPAFLAVVVYLIFAVPVVLWLRGRRLKGRVSVQEAEETLARPSQTREE